MNSLLRIATLALFGAAGVALAIWLVENFSPMSGATTRATIAARPDANDTASSVTAKHDAEPAANSKPVIAKRQAAQGEEETSPAADEANVGEPAPTRRPLVQPAAMRRDESWVQPVRYQADQEEAFLRGAIGALKALGGQQPSAPLPEPTPAAQRATERSPVEATAQPTPKARVTKSPREGDDAPSITIQNAEIREVLELLSEQGGLNILTSKSVDGTVSATLKDVNVETALDAILKSTGYAWRREGPFIYVGTASDFATMRHAADRVGTRLYRPNYVTAKELQQLISPLLTEGIGTMSVNTPAEAGIAPDANSAGGDAFAGQETVLVRDYEAVLFQVDQVVDQVDRRPTQVAIEAMILSVKLNDETDIGINFEMLQNRNHIRIPSGEPLTTLADFSVDSKGFQIGYLDSTLSSLVQFLETIGETNVIATPRLTCLNKHRAEILIGEQLGYVSTTQTETSTTQSVEFLEVGTQLRLRPFISDDGLIRMEVHPELSTGNVRLEGGFTLPDKEVTQVTTNIMVRDGSTVIIGGLLRDELATSATQIPLLGSLPVVGPFFRQTNEEIERREILVLITPHIVDDKESHVDAEMAAAEFHHRQSVYADNMSRFSKVSMGRRYFYLAQDAWSQGDRKKALRLVNLSIHFNPLNRAAIDLRNDIARGNPVGDHTAPPPGEPADNVGPWFVEGETSPAVDPGRPGERNDIDWPQRQ